MNSINPSTLPSLTLFEEGTETCLSRQYTYRKVVSLGLENKPNDRLRRGQKVEDLSFIKPRCLIGILQCFLKFTGGQTVFLMKMGKNDLCEQQPLLSISAGKEGLRFRRKGKLRGQVLSEFRKIHLEVTDKTESEVFSRIDRQKCVNGGARSESHIIKRTDLETWRKVLLIAKVNLKNRARIYTFTSNYKVPTSHAQEE